MASVNIPVYSFDPLRDQRWTAFIEHSGASVFHTAEWMEALRRTYGYQPAGITCSGPGHPIDNGIVFCRVRSWLTGHRLVSLPFSDHCQPLASSTETLKRLMAALSEELTGAGARYIEVRPQSAPADIRSRFEFGESYCSHTLNLSPKLEDIFRRFHKDCVQRKIRRAERDGLAYECGNSDILLEKFYDLIVMTRRRHGAPAQPVSWYRNLVACMGDRLKIRVAFKNDLHVAAILTLQHGRTLMYKYGGSDARFHNHGGMQMLLWKAIQDAKREGLHEFDMGRSDWHNPGLIEFKQRWGAAKSHLQYLSYSTAPAFTLTRGQLMTIAGHIAAIAPARLITIAARLTYRHLG